MKTSELIQKVGDKNFKVQVLDGCLISANYSAEEGVNEITFGTDAHFSPDGLKEIGIVVWLPRDKVDEVLYRESEAEAAAHKAYKPSAPNGTALHCATKSKKGENCPEKPTRIAYTGDGPADSLFLCENCYQRWIRGSGSNSYAEV
jgi:hypothetical protein